MSRGQANVGVEGDGQAAQQGDSGLGAALFDAFDLVDGHLSSSSQFGDTETQGRALVVDGLAEGQCLPDGDPLGIVGLLPRADRHEGVPHLPGAQSAPRPAFLVPSDPQTPPPVCARCAGDTTERFVAHAPSDTRMPA